MRTRLHMRVLCGAQTIICAVRMSYSAAAHVLAGFINARPRRGRVAVWLEACGATLRDACWCWVLYVSWAVRCSHVVLVLVLETRKKVPGIVRREADNTFQARA